ncbi:MAG TPA: hypothetical protein VLH86_01590 [Patescibacteria group bacterium]|nr:hypothetical protein [Patescibacteria group bacterium]
MKQLFKSRPLLLPAVILGVSFVLYAAGITLLFVPAVVGCLVYYLPYPRLFRSIVSKVVAGFMIACGLITVAAVGQFLVVPHTGFRMLSLLAALLTMGAVVFGSKHLPSKPAPVVWYEKKDVAALVTVMFFALPVIVLTGMWRGGDVLSIAKFGSVQSADGANHFVMLTQISKEQHLDYAATSYYPKGFHIVTAFVEDSFYANQSQLRFGLNARLFVVQYLVYGMALAYLVFYLCRMIADIIGDRLKRRADFVLAICLGLPLGFFYLIPFMYQGFINYYYVLALFVLGLIYVHEFYELSQTKQRATGEWFLLTYMVFIFGIGMSWPLLLPPLLLIPALYILPQKWVVKDIPVLVRAVLARRHWPVLGAVVLQLTPIYLQLKYATINTGEQFNALGSVRAFHFGVFVLGLAAMIYFALSERFPETCKRFINNTFLPLYLFMLLLIAFQYFSSGEIRYYSIKSGYLIELLVLALTTVLAVYIFIGAKIGRLQQLVMPVIVVVGAFTLLIGMSTNPLQGAREMFRSISGFGVPDFFDSDVRQLVNVGSSGNLYGDNAIILHYDPPSDKLVGDMMISNWNVVMARDDTPNTAAHNCGSDIFGIAMYKEPNKGQQRELKETVRKCSNMVLSHNRNYYIITDDRSVPYLRQFFGDKVVISHFHL